MSQVDPETNHWAILVGVNFYKEKRLFQAAYQILVTRYRKDLESP